MLFIVEADAGPQTGLGDEIRKVGRGLLTQVQAALKDPYGVKESDSD